MGRGMAPTPSQRALEAQITALEQRREAQIIALWETTEAIERLRVRRRAMAAGSAEVISFSSFAGCPASRRPQKAG